MVNFNNAVPEIYETVEVLNFPITVQLYRTGEDRIAVVQGGCRHHIGSVSVARFENGVPRLEKILLPEHRDDVVGDMFATALCEKLHANVCVVCGIHYDISGKENINEIVAAAKTLLEKLAADLI